MKSFKIGNKTRWFEVELTPLQDRAAFRTEDGQEISLPAIVQRSAEELTAGGIPCRDEPNPVCKECGR